VAEGRKRRESSTGEGLTIKELQAKSEVKELGRHTAK
jgi:hypothetical protein